MLGSFLHKNMPTVSISDYMDLDSLAFTPTRSEYLGAEMAGAFDRTTTSMALNEGDIREREKQLGSYSEEYERQKAEYQSLGYGMEQLGVHPNAMSREDWERSEYYREGIKWTEEMTEGRAQVYAENYDMRRFRESLIAAGDEAYSFPTKALGFGAMLLGGLPDPLNFVPFASGLAKGTKIVSQQAALRAGQMASRAAAESVALRSNLWAGVRSGAAIGAIEGAAGTLAIDSLVVPYLASQGEELGWQDVLLDTTFGALVASGLGGLGGGITGYIGGRRMARIAGEYHDIIAELRNEYRGRDPFGTPDDNFLFGFGDVFTEEHFRQERALDRLRYEVLEAWETTGIAKEMERAGVNVEDAAYAQLAIYKRQADYIAAHSTDGRVGSQYLDSINIRAEIRPEEVEAWTARESERDRIWHQEQERLRAEQERLRAEQEEAAAAAAADKGKGKGKGKDKGQGKGQGQGRTQAPDTSNLEARAARIEAEQAARDATAVQAERIEGQGFDDVLDVPDAPSEPIHYVLVEADSLRPSHDAERGFVRNADYPFENDRQYHQEKASQEAVLFAARTLNPRKVLSRSATAVEGAPIIDHEGNVLGGNQRSMMLKLAYASFPEQSAKYKEALKTNAKFFGIDENLVDSMQKPVLVRRLSNQYEPEVRNQLIPKLNRVDTKARNPRAEGFAAGKSLDDKALDALAQGMEKEGARSIKEFLNTRSSIDVVNALEESGFINASNKSALVEDGKLNSDGRAFLEFALVSRVAENFQSFSDLPAKYINTISKAVPYLVSAENTPGFSLQTAMHEAVNLLNKFNKDKRNNAGWDTETFLSTQDAISGKSNREIASKMGVALFEKIIKLKPSEFADALKIYARDAKAGGGASGLVGGGPSPKAARKKLAEMTATDISKFQNSELVKAGKIPIRAAFRAMTKDQLLSVLPKKMRDEVNTDVSISDLQQVVEAHTLQEERRLGRENDPLYQDTRGAFIEQDGRKVIKLHAFSDMSTLAHEGWHAFFSDLERMIESGAADDISKADYKRIYDFVGGTEGQALTVEQRELMAKAGEAFLREGKIPHPELAGVFGRFSEWLSKIYTDVNDLTGGKAIGDDVKEVFTSFMSATRNDDADFFRSSISNRARRDLLRAQEKAIDDFANGRAVDVGPILRNSALIHEGNLRGDRLPQLTQGQGQVFNARELDFRVAADDPVSDYARARTTEGTVGQGQGQGQRPLSEPPIQPQDVLQDPIIQQAESLRQLGRLNDEINAELSTVDNVIREVEQYNELGLAVTECVLNVAS